MNNIYKMIFGLRLCAKALHIPTRVLPANLILPILAGKIKGKKWIAGSGPYSCWLGMFEYEKRVLFESMIKEGSIVFDIGAHVGFYTLLASVLCGDAGMVFAFEPVPSNLIYLKDHIGINNLSNVRVIEAAVTTFNGFASFKEHSDNTQGHLSADGTLLVKTVSIDRLVSEGEIPLPNFIKIDVEGSEKEVIEGAFTLLEKSHPTIFLSTHGPDLHRECCFHLVKLGYKLVPIGDSRIAESDEILAL